MKYTKWKSVFRRFCGSVNVTRVILLVLAAANSQTLSAFTAFRAKFSGVSDSNVPKDVEICIFSSSLSTVKQIVLT